MRREIGAGLLRVMQVSMGDDARPVGLSLGFGRGIGNRLERRGGLPVAHFKLVNRRVFGAIVGKHAGHVAIGHVRHVLEVIQHVRRLVQNLPGLRVLTGLQIGIQQEVVGVKLVHGAALMVRFRGLRGFDRADIGVDVFLPQSQARKDMAGHVHGVRAGRRDLAVVARRGESVGRECRCIARMNYVMHDTGMVGESPEQRAQHGHRVAIRGEAGIAR